jgi:diaminopropionate ammonia-lyase
VTDRTRVFVPDARPGGRPPVAEGLGGDPLAFHRTLPGYGRTPLVGAPGLAGKLGLGSLWIKDESTRFGLPSFKILGASWAIRHALEDRLGVALPTFRACREATAASPGLELVAATDGNHGHAVARVARLLGIGCEIVVPVGVPTARLDAIRAEGASLVTVDGSYDDAVEASAALASRERLVISDTSWPGYTDIPRRVVQGYATLLGEADDQLRESGVAAPDVVVVQTGVGALAAAVAGHFAGMPPAVRPRLVAVEPLDAGCVFASAVAGRRVTVPGPHRSVMAGLNCGAPSLIAWPAIEASFDAYVLIGDDEARRAVGELSRVGTEAGETGAAGLAGLTHLTGQPKAVRERLGLGPDAAALVLATEGPTDAARLERTAA